MGGEGKVYEMTTDTHAHDGMPARMLGRTANLSEQGEMRIDNLRARLKRGTGTNLSEGTFAIRCRRDSGKWTPWKRKGLGRRGSPEMFVEFGGWGSGQTWQFEWSVTDDCPVELIKLEAQITRLGE